MAVKIGHAVKNEFNKVKGGRKGDQTGTEITIANWYQHRLGWGTVIRAKDPKVAEIIASTVEKICSNDNFGYGQEYALSGFEELQKVNFDPTKVKTKCGLDCSMSVRAGCYAAGIKVERFRTKNEAKILKATGKFEILTSSKYLKSSKHLKRGDILCTPAGISGHTVVVLNDGAEVVKEKQAQANKVEKEPVKTTVKYNEAKVKTAKYYNKSLKGAYKTTCGLNLRYGAGTSNDKILKIPKGEKVKCYGYYNKVVKTKWYLVEYGDYVGYCSSKYLTK